MDQTKQSCNETAEDMASHTDVNGCQKPNMEHWIITVRVASGEYQTNILYTLKNKQTHVLYKDFDQGHFEI